MAVGGTYEEFFGGQKRGGGKQTSSFKPISPGQEKKQKNRVRSKKIGGQLEGEKKRQVEKKRSTQSTEQGSKTNNNEIRV